MGMWDCETMTQQHGNGGMVDNLANVEATPSFLGSSFRDLMANLTMTSHFHSQKAQFFMVKIALPGYELRACWHVFFPDLVPTKMSFLEFLISPAKNLVP